jgi:flagellar hook-associated protein 1 FlgK
MSTLMGLMDLSRNALLADQGALNITANNVANQNTVGYTAEVATWSSGDTVTLSGNSSSGPSVTTTSLRDRVLEQRVQQQTQAQSGTAAEAAVLSQVEGVFSITGSSASQGSTQLGTSINAFFTSLTALAANPSNEPTQQGALSAASTVANAFNAAATGLAGVQTSINGNIASSVTAVNALTKTIAALNAQIGSNSPSTDAGTLEDQRQSAIAQLSQYVGLNQVATESNGITLTTTGGAVLVAGQQSYALSSSQVGSGTTVYDSTGKNVSAGISGGSIGGQLAAQNVDLPAMSSALDALAYRIGTAVNAQNEAGLTSAGAAGAAIFKVPASAAGAAAALAVIPTNPGAVATAGVGEGSTGNTNVNALANLATATDSSGQTLAGNLSALLSNVGSNSALLQGQSTAQQASLTQLTTQRDSLSRVNLDTEASNLTTYQRSYQAAAQVMTIVDRLMASAINLGTQTTVS